MGTRKAPRRAGAELERHVLLRDALGTGVLEFLSIQNTVAILSSCVTLRNDSPLALVALTEHGPASEYGRHLFQGCESDWFSTCTRTCVKTESDCSANAARLFGKCHDDVHLACDFATRASACGLKPVLTSSSPTRAISSVYSDPLLSMEVSRRPWFFTQLLSLVGAMDKCVLPYIQTKNVTPPSYWDDKHVLFVPVAINLGQHHHPSHSQQEWTKRKIRDALNTCVAELGEHFLSPKEAFVSKFGVHWDSITPKAAASDSAALSGWRVDVQCDLCINTAVGLERVEEMAGFMDAPFYYTDKRRRELTEQGASELEIEYGIQELMQNYADVQQWTSTLAYAISMDHITLPYGEAVDFMDVDELVDALSDDSEYPVQCREASQLSSAFCSQTASSRVALRSGSYRDWKTTFESDLNSHLWTWSWSAASRPRVSSAVRLW